MDQDTRNYLDEKFAELATKQGVADLEQRTGNQLADVVTLIDGRFDRVEERLHSVEGRLDSIEDRIDSAVNQVSGHEKRVSYLEDRILR